MDSMASSQWSMQPNASPSTIPPKGFPRNIIVDCSDPSAVDSKLICSECHLVLRRPVQGPCGHRFCNSCINHVASSNEEGLITCRACEADGVSETFSKSEVHMDFALARKEYPRIKTHCSFNGCNWTGSLKDYEGHHDVCPHAMVECEICGEKIGHDMTLDQHISNDIAKHVFALFKRVADAERVFDEGNIRVSAVERAATKLDNQSQRHIQQTRQLHQQQTQEQRSSSAGGTKVVTDGMRGRDVPDNDDQCDFVGTKRRSATDTIEGSIIVLGREIENLCQREQTTAQANREMADRLHITESKMNVLERLIKQRDERIKELQLHIEVLEETSYDGTITWRISNFSDRRAAAVNGTCPTLYSPPFYTSRTGYKLCLRLYLNGDGQGRSTHVSLFVVIMKGMYDPLLEWPFRHRITLSVLRQSIDGSSTPVTAETFRPDPTSSSFRRPNENMNTATGFPRFLPLEKLSDPVCVRDDVMFISGSVIVEA